MARWDSPLLLTLDVVPETCHYSNLRTELPRATWDVLRKAAYGVANFRCVICGGHGGNGRQHPVEAHEKWEYDINGPEGPVQRLVEIQALCPPCHEVKHFGLAQVRGNEDRALKHLMSVNGWTRAAAKRRVAEEQATYVANSAILWDLDVSVIDDDEATLLCWTRRRAKNKELRRLQEAEAENNRKTMGLIEEILVRLVEDQHRGQTDVGDLIQCPTCSSSNVVATATPTGIALACKDCGLIPGEVNPEPFPAEASPTPDWTVTEMESLEKESESETEVAAPQVDEDELAGFRWVR